MGISGVSLDKNVIIEAILKNNGVITHAAASIGCSPQAIYAWMDKDEDVKKAVLDGRAEGDKERMDMDEIIKEKAYKSMLANLDKYDITATIYALKTKAKWGEGNGDKGTIIQAQFIKDPYDIKQLEADPKN